MSRLRSVALVLSALAAAMVLVAPPAANAMTFRQSRGGTVVIGPNETIDDDLYASGDSVVIRGTVNGTVFAAGNTVSVDGSVSGDVWAAGNDVSVGGTVGNTVHAAGNQVTVGGQVHGDVTAAGNTVVLASTLNSDRDAALAGNTVSIDGRVGRNVFAGASDLAIAGSVGGDVNAGVRRLTIAQGANVGGTVRYTSENEASVAKGATVSGGLRRSQPREVPRPSPVVSAFATFVLWLRRLIGLLLFGLIVVLAFPRFTERAAGEIRGRPLPSLGLGLAFLIGVPWVAAMVFVIGVLVGGWWIALFAIALYAIAVAVATIVSAVFLGRWIFGLSPGRHPHHVLALLIGLLILTVLETVPLLGVLVRMAEVVFGLGAVVLAIAPAMRAQAPARPASPYVPQPPPPA